MRRPDEPTVRRLLLAGVVLLVVVVSAAIVHRRMPAESWDDPERVSGGAALLAMGSVLPDARLAHPVRVAVVRDPASAQYHGAERLDTLLARWERELREIGAEPLIVEPAALRSRVADVVVVPATPCIGADTHRAIVEAGRLGRGVVLTWLTGIRDAACTPIGYGLVVSLTGAARVDTLETRAENYVVFPTGGVLATDIPPGARMELLSGNHVALRRPAGRDAYHADFDLDAAPVAGHPLMDGAVVAAEHGGGRVVYWGFDLHHVADQQWSREIARLLLRNTIAWTAGLTLASLEPWKHGKRSAAVLAQDVEDEFANARHALDTLRQLGIRGTYYLVTDLARSHEALVEALAGEGEIGSHSENHRLLGGLPPELQMRRLAGTQEQIRRLTGEAVAGLRPPEEQFDLATLEAWRKAGGAYVAAANDSRAASPEVLLVDGEPLILLGRVVNDDFTVLRRAGVTDAAEQARIYVTDSERMRALGGLYLFSYHSNMLARPENVAALGVLARRLAGQHDTWLATAVEVADWWLSRAAVRVSAERSQDGDVTVGLRNDGPARVDGAVLRIALGGGRVAAATSAGRLLDSAPGVARIALPALAPHATLTVRITLAGGDASRAY
ncbi:MAG TPA: polysaccharide deacetylase family protein [Gemmatimonadaceae bacterium]|nr:polysaccharide deacetylase family protein [Gemmatimonadaceae bacterium]